AAADCPRRWRNAASRRAPRMRPSVATKPAASSRACSTILSLPDVDPDEPALDADEAPPLVPAKLDAWAGALARTSSAQAQAQAQSNRIMAWGRWWGIRRRTACRG